MVLRLFNLTEKLFSVNRLYGLSVYLESVVRQQKEHEKRTIGGRVDGI